MLIISSWLCPKCTFILLYTALQDKLWKKGRDVSNGWGGGVCIQKNVHMTFLWTKSICDASLIVEKHEILSLRVTIMGYIIRKPAKKYV